MKRLSIDSAPYLFGLALPLLAAAIWVSGLPFSPDGDLYLHLKCGEWMLAHGRFLTHDLFTYTAFGQTDETSQSWLSQVIFHLVFRAGGTRALACFHLLLVSALLVQVFHFTYQRTGRWSLGLVLATLTLLLQNRTPGLRPLIFGQLFVFYLGLYTWEKPLTGKRTSLYLALGLIWAQLHASHLLFFLWLLTLGLHRWKYAPERRALLILFAGSIFTFFLTPLGFERVGYLIQILGQSSRGAEGEWAGAQPLQWIGPRWIRLSLDIQDLALLTAAGLGMAAFRKRFSFPALALFLLGLFPLFSIRHLCFLAVPLAYFTVGLPARVRFPRLLAVPLSLALLWGFNFRESYYVNPPAAVASSVFSAMQLRGNVFNYHAWGSQLIFDHFPQAKVATDNRSVLHRDFFARLRAWEKDPAHSVRENVLAALPPDTDILFLTTPSRPQPWLNPNTWWIVFENNSVTIAVKRDAKNSSNRRNVLSYYRESGLPFNENSDFEFAKVWRSNRTQAERWLESSPYGEWPSPGFPRLWRDGLETYLRERQIAAGELG